MRNRPYSKWISRLFIVLVAGMALTGFAQMPITKRYYIASVPLLGWTGDFFTVHRVHYALTALLLFLLALVVTNWLLRWRRELRLTPLGWARVAILAGLVVSGGFRVSRNFPSVSYSPAFTLAFDWVHLVLTVVFGVVALAAVVAGRSAYARRR